jgi:hypothetical protein
MQNDEEQPDVASPIEPVVSCDWVDTSVELPSTNEKFGESEHVLCIGVGIYPFTGWYNSKSKQWFNSDIHAETVPLKVRFWRDMIELPQPN